jgi:hypothetical protein
VNTFQGNPKSGIDQFLHAQTKAPEFQSTKEQADYIVGEFAELMETLKNGEPIPLPRTWGYEIETPEADKVYHNTTSTDRELIEFHQDGSVGSGDGCECDCSSCRYHECDCDDCENRNTDPDHDCGSSWCQGQYQEIVSVGGLGTTKPEALERLETLGIRDCEITDDCGLHIHIHSADLSPLQVSRVLTAWRLLADILDPLAGAHRKRNRYCADHSPEDEERVRKGESAERYLTWNTQSHFSPKHGRPQTLELRKHEGTNDPDRVRAWAYLAVSMVEFAKSNRPTYWLTKCRTLAQALGELGKVRA